MAVRPSSTIDGASSHGLAMEKLAPGEYATAVSAFSNLRTRCGQHHKGLAEFLEGGPSFVVDINGSTNSNTTRSGTKNTFLTIYDVNSPAQPGQKGIINRRDYASCAEFESSPPRPDSGACGQIVFMRGYPSPAWLNLIGSEYMLDPEFFARHLEFLSPMTGPSNFSVPALPSYLNRMLQLHITTIGSRDCDRRKYEQEEIDEMRESDKTEMSSYFRQISAGTDIRVGDGLIRYFSTLDETHFAVEQRISIYIQERGMSWTAFVCTDSGNDLSKSLKGPWSMTQGEMQLHPVINYRPNDALNPDFVNNQIALAQSASLRNTRELQTAALLHENYGNTLRLDIAAHDVMYALNEVFSLSACSEAQFLNLVGSKLRKHLDDNSAQEFDSLSNLKFMRSILDRHIQQLQENINAIRNTKLDRLWPKPVHTETLRNISETKTESMLRDFTHNLQHARSLDTRCHEAISILMSTTSIAESKKAMAQQERLAKLTFLAFLFVPLGFTTSFFSMNFPELNKEHRSIWEWIVFSCPLVAFTVIAFFVNFEKLSQKVKWNKTKSKIT